MDLAGLGLTILHSLAINQEARCKPDQQYLDLLLDLRLLQIKTPFISGFICFTIHETKHKTSANMNVM
jgi:hypothetical protein